WPVGAPFGRSRKDIPNDMGSLYALVDRKNLFGEELHKALVHQLTRQTAMTSAAEMLPSASNYVVPSSSLAFVVPGTDGSITIPRPEIRYSVDDYAHEGLDFASEFHKFVHTRLGVASEKDIHIDQENKYYGSGHIMGTTIMGKVVDGDCRSLDHRNLFI